MKKETFIDELAETVERLWDDAPPRIVLHGWWWKQYIPFFRRQQRVITEMWESQWGNNRHEHKERMNFKEKDILQRMMRDY